MRSLHLARRLVVAGLAFAWALGAASTFAEVEVPPLRERITDLTGTLNAEQRSGIDSKLTKLEGDTGAQVAVLIVPTTAPETIEQYGLRVAEKWELGRKGVDDGALLLIALGDRALRIEVGYGLEGTLPDARSKRIIDEIIVPYFRNGDVAGGVGAGVDQMIATIRGEVAPGAEASPVSPSSERQSRPSDSLPILIFALPAFAALGSALRRALGPLPAAALAGGGTTALAWLILGSLVAGVILGIGVGVFMMASTGRRPGLFLPFPSGHGGFGGGGGGGFSGGGGGFGGGGASGRW